jgi:hypothetical protein
MIARPSPLNFDQVSSPAAASPAAVPGSAPLGTRNRTLRMGTDKLNGLLNLPGERLQQQEPLFTAKAFAQ